MRSDVTAACRWFVQCTNKPEAKARASEKDGSFDFDWKSEPKESDTDPRGPAVGGSRIARGGGWHEGGGEFRFSYRCRHLVDCLYGNGGFCLACPAATAK